MQPTEPWHLRLLPDLELPWTRVGTERQGGVQEIKLQPGVEELLDLATYGLNAKMRLCVWNERRNEDDFLWHHSPYTIGEYAAEILVLSDNAAPLRRTICFEANMQSAGFARALVCQPIQGATTDTIQDLTR